MHALRPDIQTSRSYTLIITRPGQYESGPLGALTWGTASSVPGAHPFPDHELALRLVPARLVQQAEGLAGSVQAAPVCGGQGGREDHLHLGPVH